MEKVFEKIYEEVKKIPRGQTATYGEIAKRGEPVPPARWKWEKGRFR